MRRWILLGLVACACGSSNGGNNPAGSITGTVQGQALDVQDAVFGIEGNVVYAYIADRTGLCGLLGGTTLPGTTKVLELRMANVTGANSIGDHTVGSYAWLDAKSFQGSAAGLYWRGTFVVASTCTSYTYADATAGTLSVTQVGNSSGTHLKATLNSLKFGTDTLNGSFEATYCAAAIDSPSCGSTLRAPLPAPSE